MASTVDASGFAAAYNSFIATAMGYDPTDPASRLSMSNAIAGLAAAATGLIAASPVLKTVAGYTGVLTAATALALDEWDASVLNNDAPPPANHRKI
jgi:hypothetical protein